MDAIAELADKALADPRRVDILINNAGRSIRRSLELSYDPIHDYQCSMQLNYLAAVQLILKFIPDMPQRGFGQIINLSSAGAQTRAPHFGRTSREADKAARKAIREQKNTAEAAAGSTARHPSTPSRLPHRRGKLGSRPQP